MVNPYTPLPVSDTDRRLPFWFGRLKQLPVLLSCFIAAAALLYGLSVIVFIIATSSSASIPVSMQRSMFAKLSIILLLSVVCTFINLLAAFRWQKGHWGRALLYNFVAIAVVLGPLTVIPWRLLLL